MSEQTLKKIKDYHNNLINKTSEPGPNLEEECNKTGKSFRDLNTEEFIDILIKTKKPVVFAESNKSKRWNLDETDILLDVSITGPAEFYDNGAWDHNNTNPKGIKVHKTPIKGELLFTPGPLLSAPLVPKTNLYEVTVNGDGKEIDQIAYNALIERRILPVLVEASEQSKIDGKKLVINFPGLGAGEFAGEFKGRMCKHLNLAIQNILKKHSSKLGNIELIRFDSYDELEDEDKKFGGIKYRVRPKLRGNNKDICQLSSLPTLQEKGDNFSNCKLVKVVAADPLSMPLNDAIGGYRYTDEGAMYGTDFFINITGVEGKYDPQKHHYLPPEPNNTWEDIAKHVPLQAKGRIKIVSNNAESYSLEEYEKKLDIKDKTIGTTAINTNSTKIESSKTIHEIDSTHASSATIQDNVIIYSAKVNDPQKPEVALKFETQEKRDKFVKNMILECNKYNIDLSPMFRTNDLGADPTVVYINHSNYPESGVPIGSYKALDGELAIGFDKNVDLSKKFQSMINLNSSQSFTDKGSIYFTPEVLPVEYDPNRKKNIITTTNYLDISTTQNDVASLSYKTNISSHIKEVTTKTNNSEPYKDISPQTKSHLHTTSFNAADLEDNRPKSILIPTPSQKHNINIAPSTDNLIPVTDVGRVASLNKDIMSNWPKGYKEVYELLEAQKQDVIDPNKPIDKNHQEAMVVFYDNMENELKKFVEDPKNKDKLTTTSVADNIRNIQGIVVDSKISDMEIEHRDEYLASFNGKTHNEKYKKTIEAISNSNPPQKSALYNMGHNPTEKPMTNYEATLKKIQFMRNSKIMDQIQDEAQKRILLNFFDKLSIKYQDMNDQEKRKYNSLLRGELDNYDKQKQLEVNQTVSEIPTVKFKTIEIFDKLHREAIKMYGYGTSIPLINPNNSSEHSTVTHISPNSDIYRKNDNMDLDHTEWEAINKRFNILKYGEVGTNNSGFKTDRKEITSVDKNEAHYQNDASHKPYKEDDWRNIHLEKSTSQAPGMKDKLRNTKDKKYILLNDEEAELIRDLHYVTKHSNNDTSKKAAELIANFAQLYGAEQVNQAIEKSIEEEKDIQYNPYKVPDDSKVISGKEYTANMYNALQKKASIGKYDRHYHTLRSTIKKVGRNRGKNNNREI